MAWSNGLEAQVRSGLGETSAVGSEVMPVDQGIGDKPPAPQRKGRSGCGQLSTVAQSTRAMSRGAAAHLFRRRTYGCNGTHAAKCHIRLIRWMSRWMSDGG